MSLLQIISQNIKFLILISSINKFYGENSIIKKLFLFKGINNKYFNIHNKYYKINELISLTSDEPPSNCFSK